MPDVNESTKFTHFSNVAVGTSSGGGRFKINEVELAGNEADTVTGATTLTAASKQIQLLDAAEGATVTLPTLADGLRFKFIVASTFITSNFVIASAEGDNINGFVHNIVDGAIVAGLEDQINLVVTAESVGDWYEFVADSTNSQWIVSGISALTGATTATDPA